MFSSRTTRRDAKIFTARMLGSFGAASSEMSKRECFLYY